MGCWLGMRLSLHPLTWYLNPNGVTADTGAIKIFAADTNKIAFNSSNLRSNIDFTKREGKFTANNVNDLTYLPFNQYGSNMNDYKWNMDDKTIDI